MTFSKHHPGCTITLALYSPERHWYSPLQTRHDIPISKWHVCYIPLPLPYLFQLFLLNTSSASSPIVWFQKNRGPCLMVMVIHSMKQVDIPKPPADSEKTALQVPPACRPKDQIRIWRVFFRWDGLAKVWWSIGKKWQKNVKQSNLVSPSPMNNQMIPPTCKHSLLLFQI